jgi:hypothetical protein
MSLSSAIDTMVPKYSQRGFAINSFVYGLHKLVGQIEHKAYFEIYVQPLICY